MFQDSNEECALSCPCARSFCKDVPRPGARSGKSSVKSWCICWCSLSWLTESEPGGSQSGVAKSKPSHYSTDELRINHHVAKKELSLAFMLSSHPGVNPLPTCPTKCVGQFKLCSLIFSISYARGLCKMRKSKTLGLCPACVWHPACGFSAFIFNTVFGEEINESTPFCHAPRSTSPSSPCRNARAWRFFLLTGCDSLAGKRWCGWSRTQQITPLWFPVKNCSVGSPPECILQPTCSAPCLLQHCWWGTTHSCHSECLWWNEKIYDLPYSPSTSTVPPTSAFPELEGQKFKSCFEELLTRYQLLHIASAGRIWTISLEMSLLK